MKIKIGNKYVGNNESIFITAEAGINHNGDIDIARGLIDIASSSGCDAIKFQKRTVDIVYTKEELNKPRDSPWGTTQREQKEGIEFGKKEYDEINRYCKEKQIMWYASCWDEKSVDFIDKYNPPCYKIASASLTDDALLRYTKSKGKPLILSTGMSTMDQIKHAIDILGEENIIILHCTSTYPSKPEELNLKVIQQFKKQFSCPIGYSGHEVGLSESIVAASLGACMIERHITLDRAMYGSDQSASIEPQGIRKLVKDLREIEIILGDGNKKVYKSEIPIIKKLRRNE